MELDTKSPRNKIAKNDPDVQVSLARPRCFQKQWRTFINLKIKFLALLSVVLARLRRWFLPRGGDNARPPFERTKCACPECIACCRRPGQLIPSDVSRLVGRLIVDGRAANSRDALRFFRRAPLSVVQDRLTGSTRVILCAVPAVGKDGYCILFDAVTHGCTVHDVSPFGCAFFDTHMDESSRELEWRRGWGEVAIEGSREYARFISELAEAEASLYMNEKERKTIDALFAGKSWK